MTELTKRLNRRWLFPLVLLLAIIIAVILIATKPSAKTAGAAEAARRVDTITVSTGQYAPTVPLYVKVTTPYHSRLRASITADVKQVITLQGSLVKKDDILIELDDREARLVKQQRQADVVDAQSQIDTELLNHKNELFVIRNDKGKRAEHNREQIIKGHQIRLKGLKAKLQHAKTSLELAELDLQRTRIPAPFDGQITRTQVSPGDRVRPGDILIEIFDRGSLELTGTIAQRYAAVVQQSLTQGHELTATTQWQGQSLTASLQRLTGDVDEQSGGLQAIFRIEKHSQQLSLGRSLRLQLQLPQIDNTFVVPNTAIFGTNRVYKIVDNRLKTVDVTRLGDFDTRNAVPSSLLQSQAITDGDILLKTQLPNAIENLLVSPAN